MSGEFLLLTGASGFIGSRLAHRLLDQGRYRPVILTRKATPRVDALREKGAVVAEGFFGDPETLDRIFGEHPVRSVIHAAAIRGEGAGSPAEYHRVNVLGTETLLDASLRHKVRRFLFTSSVGVFGTIPPVVPATVRTPPAGDGEYHRSKVLGEEKVLEYVRKGLDAYIVRPTVTYGEGDDGFPSSLAGMVRRRLFVSGGDPRIHLLDVDRLADVFLALLEPRDPGQRVFLVADERPVRLRELVDAIHVHYHGSPYPAWLRIPDLALPVLRTAVRWTMPRKWTIRLKLVSNDWCYDIGDTMRLLDYRPSETIGGFREFLAKRDGSAKPAVPSRRP